MLDQMILQLQAPWGIGPERIIANRDATPDRKTLYRTTLNRTTVYRKTLNRTTADRNDT